MFCKECGKQVIESDMFCKNCGTPVKIEADHLSKSEEGAKIHEDAQEIGITGQDESSKQRLLTKHIEVTVPNEATDIDASKQTVKKKSVKEKKNKKPKGKMFKLIIPVVVLVGIIIFSFYSIYAQTTDYSGMQGRATSSWQLYNERVYDNEDENLTINIDIEDLNAYINDKDILSEIKIDGFKIQSVCFSTEEEEVYMNVKKGSSPPVDIIADYELHVVNDSLILNLKPSSIGLNVPIISTITLATKYDIRLLEIPMNSSLEEIDNQFMVSLLAGQDLIPKLKRKEFILEYSLEDVLVNEEAINISEATIEEPVVIHEGDIQYVSIQQGYLVGKVLQDVSVIQLLKEKDIEGDYYIGKNQELYLRAKDNISGANYDLELIFSYELEEDALILETVKGAKGSVLDEALVTTLYEAYGSVFMSNRPDVLDKYKIISVSTEDNDLRFQVDQASWTILIYMNGSDLESSYYNGGLLGSGTNDLNEMMTGLVSDSVQVVIETGGTLEWVMPEIDASQNQRW
nr:zinc ribbon domain-containing protein [Vallitaleaceae bacterium]